MLSNLLIRADANTRMGTGHVMRCLALAQAWQDAGGQAQFVAAEMPDRLAARLAVEGIALHRLNVAPGSSDDATQTTALAQRLGAAWVVEDGYHFGADYQRTVKAANLRLLAIDDYGHAGHYVADLVLNQNIYADESLYPSREPATRLLLGTHYALLRREFLRWRGWQREIPDVARKVLVTMGGSDPDNVTLKVIQALEEVPIEGLEVVVVVGASNPHRQSLAEAVNRSPIALRLAHDVHDMPKLMAWGDLAVTAAGSTCWEMAFMALPMATVVLADNQHAVAEGVQSSHASINLGWAKDTSIETIVHLLTDVAGSTEQMRELSHKARATVDGYGVVRASSLLERGRNDHDHVQVRPVLPEDVDHLWKLANDPTVRVNSFHPQAIPYEQHVSWFAQKLLSSQSLIWIAETCNVFAGQIRYDRTDDATAEIDFSVTPQSRGKGIGTTMLIQTRHTACQALGVSRLRGLVINDNHASRNTFLKAGFVERLSELEVSGKRCHEFVWQR